MHARLLVLTSKDNAKTSEKAREYVRNFLDNEGFCGEGFFNSSYADWFVIGGRWSGDLTEALLDKEKVKKFWKEFEDKKFGYVGIDKNDKEDNKTRKKGQALFRRYFPDFTGRLPIYRDTYNELGFDDDAKIVNEKLFDSLLKDCEGADRAENGEWGGLTAVDIEADTISKENTINKKWVVVVDYHN